ncbi:MAG: hypothetical protein KF777_00215 [Planctomycetaceae bacterium]|nr:hypothetical protein [Planctomycetaceae bacterium]
MTDLLSKVSQLAGAREAERAARYRELVIEVADGGDPAPDEVVDVLEAAHKSPADLRNDVQTLHRRRRLVADVQAGVAAVAERAAVSQQITDADAALERAVQSHRESVVPLQHEVRRLLDVEQAGRTAAQDLQQTAVGPLKDEYNRAARAAETARLKVDETDQAIRRVTRQIEQLAAHIASERARGITPAQLTGETSRLERLRGERTAAESTLIDLHRAWDAAKAVQNTARENLQTDTAF